MKIYNTLTGKKEEFIPREAGKVSMYVCGPTVYNYIHIGNARAYISFDTIIRYLKYKGYEINYVRNLTDVDDKIIKKAKEENTTEEEITTKYTNAFHKDMDLLGVIKPNVEPKATEHIEDMISTIKILIEKNLAYELHGDVYFSVKNFEDYGKLSKRTIDEMQAGARVDINEQKKNPADFALWKNAKEGEPSWKSPWGNGRPGWHIECSVMSTKYLGMSFDIHGGGQDLIFPHHENEIAQAEGATGQKPFVHYWLHNGFLNIDTEKMAKSVGNIVLIKNLEDEYKENLDDLRNDTRMLFLQTHYHSPLNFSDKKMRDALASNKRISETIYRLADEIKKSKNDKVQDNVQLNALLAKTKKDFETAMDDDFNTPVALAAIFNFVKELNILLDKTTSINTQIKIQNALDLLNKLTSILGFLFEKDKEINIEMLDSITIDGKEIAPADALKMREDARKNKDFEKADMIRNKLLTIGLEIKDTSSGQILKKLIK